MPLLFLLIGFGATYKLLLHCNCTVSVFRVCYYFVYLNFIAFYLICVFKC